MCEIMYRIAEKRVEETKLHDIKSVMLSFSVSAEKAMQALNIPKEEQDKYLEM